MGHSGYRINMHGVIMILMKLTCRLKSSLGHMRHMSLVHQYIYLKPASTLICVTATFDLWLVLPEFELHRGETYPALALVQ